MKDIFGDSGNEEKSFADSGDQETSAFNETSYNDKKAFGALTSNDSMSELKDPTFDPKRRPASTLPRRAKLTEVHDVVKPNV
uniref:Uncharacterized protein n=1 Tax=Panagrolaimus sp. ES5 TaxID=591445 RepID=A0AC34FBI3_9BILA